MQRIFSYNLAVLFYLLQDKTLRIPLTNRMTKEALNSSFDSLESTINGSDTPQDMLLCREVQNNDYVVSVGEPQKHILKNYLQQYCEDIVNNRLYTEELQTFEWKHERQKFIKELVESHYNLNCYHVLDVYKLYLIAPELLRFDYKIKIEIDSRFVPQHNSSSCHELFCRKNFKFNCTLNLSSILEEQKKPKSKVIETKPKRKNFSRQQQKLYNFLKRKAKKGHDKFAKYDLREIVPLGGNALISAINRLNKQYQEIYSTEEKLIEFNRRAERFILNKNWNYDTSE